MGNKRIVLCKIAGVLVVVAGVVLCVILTKDKKKDNNEDNDTEDNYSVEYVDADQYFKEQAVEVVDSAVEESDSVLTEEQAYKLFDSLGFNQYDVTASYLMDGEYVGDVAINSSSTDKHPMYQTQYVVGDEENESVWIIYLIGDSIMAYPATYNQMEDRQVEVIVSEKETITSYDNITNKFYETIPKENVVNVVVVDKINAERLESIIME